MSCDLFKLYGIYHVIERVLPQLNREKDVRTVPDRYSPANDTRYVFSAAIH